ncbi:bZIP transcription factor [Ruegeria arenilitoris]|uniref:bZIP transcription factor n=1 Tax=Ruegeria arenilitoris TaxID=1173585 RepID=UPI00147DE9DD|nr:bZIP transcription factor [Ruegeria arenilitoris]
MKKVIFEYVDGNMAGYEWRWEVSLERLDSGSFTLSAEQTLIEADDFDEPLEVNPVSGLVLGEDIFEAFQGLVSEICGDGVDFDLEDVAKNVAALDSATGRRFLHGEELLEQRAFRERKTEQIETEARLSRFKSKIEELTSGLSDEAEKLGTTEIRSPKERVQTYLKSRLMRFEELPSKETAFTEVLAWDENVSPSIQDGWTILKYRQTSDIHGTGGICPYCGFEVRAKPLASRWNANCQCGANLDYLGQAHLKNE